MNYSLQLWSFSVSYGIGNPKDTGIQDANQASFPMNLVSLRTQTDDGRWTMDDKNGRMASAFVRRLWSVVRRLLEKTGSLS